MSAASLYLFLLPCWLQLRQTLPSHPPSGKSSTKERNSLLSDSWASPGLHSDWANVSVNHKLVRLEDASSYDGPLPHANAGDLSLRWPSGSPFYHTPRQGPAFRLPNLVPRLVCHALCHAVCRSLLPETATCQVSQIILELEGLVYLWFCFPSTHSPFS